ncbi:MAG TPA: hypothetical protein VGE46_10820 [Bdellovibrio sp.]
MNKMKTQSTKKTTTKASPASASATEINKLRALSESVGDFIRYWGFRRIHGQIWTQVFLSKASLSGADLTQRLQVSKALISPALAELEAYGLITMTEDGKKTKRYSAAPDVVPVIKNILKEREATIIANAKEHFEGLQKIHQKKGAADSSLEDSRLEELGDMISLAQFAVNFVIGQSDEESLACWTAEALKAEAK